MKPDYTALREELMRLSRTVHGVATAEVTSHPKTIVQAQVHRLMDQGKVFAAHIGHKSVRYFSTPARAQMWAASNVRQAPVTVLSADLPVVIPKGVKVQRYPTPADRFAVPAGFVGSF